MVQNQPSPRRDEAIVNGMQVARGRGDQRNLRVQFTLDRLGMGRCAMGPDEATLRGPSLTIPARVQARIPKAGPEGKGRGNGKRQVIRHGSVRRLFHAREECDYEIDGSAPLTASGRSQYPGELYGGRGPMRAARGGHGAGGGGGGAASNVRSHPGSSRPTPAPVREGEMTCASRFRSEPAKRGQALER